MFKRRQYGFTIVELLIVIVVIAILAAITVVAYNGIQTRANDSKMRTGTEQIEKAIRLWAIDNGNTIPGGSGSTTAAGATGCIDGSSGWFAKGPYICTAEEDLTATGLLPVGFTANLPKNTYYSSPTDGRFSVMFYGCGTSRYALYWTLQQPTVDDTSKLTSITSTCGHSLSSFQSYGMRSGSLIQL